MKALTVIFLILISFEYLHSSSKEDTSQIYGVTIDDIGRIDNIVESLNKLSHKPTARIVFDCGISPQYYYIAVNKIKKVSFIMGEIADSYCFAGYDNEQYGKRVNEYLDAFGNEVDIWEIGNEINGEWLGSTGAVIEKTISAYRLVKDRKKKAALTLYYNYECFEKPENEMFRWVNENIPRNMKDSLDYVFVSYYEDDCSGLQPEWQAVFDSLHVIFPNSKLGIGECGTKDSEKKKSYMHRYYTMNINTPNYAGGYFWWYFVQDCVPHTTKLWKVLNSCFNR